MKGHVPEENLWRYRNLRGLYQQLESLAGRLSGVQDYEASNRLWALAMKYKLVANELRVDIPEK